MRIGEVKLPKKTSQKAYQLRIEGEKLENIHLKKEVATKWRKNLKEKTSENG